MAQACIPFRSFYRWPEGTPRSYAISTAPEIMRRARSENRSSYRTEIEVRKAVPAREARMGIGQTAVLTFAHTGAEIDQPDDAIHLGEDRGLGLDELTEMQRGALSRMG